ncbi:MAG: CehA/McbA family metallohydrolase [Planctomycetes bacterium]|nr:CehA/McbA family metallohydrolase [Planctomycetota bacterium]
MPNSNWFEDYGPEHTGSGNHTSTYIDGHTQILLPLGKSYIEISKGFECKAIHKVLNITAKTSEITIEIEKVLPWRENGWVTADTHVHFLSPTTANLEGAAEGINMVNLLASQWGELMTNAGDFDGKNTFTVNEGDDQYLVRVGTENRQHVMGHINLCAYDGPMISPMCSGGADEAAIGDPVDITLTEWAEQCQKQNGIVVIPHSPNPRLEHAAAIVSGFVDAMEMPSFAVDISAYQLVHWYRYLNCGMQIALSGGTDKMGAGMEIGRIRTYSKLAKNRKLNLESWKNSVRSGNTFITFGPLLEWNVDGHQAGSRIKMKKHGGKVSVSWEVQTVKYDMTTVELVVNGEIGDGKRVGKHKGQGVFEVNVERSTWICLLVRGIRQFGAEVIMAHTSSVMIDVAGSQFFSAPDAISILDQIEGGMAYIDNIGTKAEVKRYKQMRLKLEGAHKVLHDQLHKHGHDHAHAPGHHKH